MLWKVLSWLHRKHLQRLTTSIIELLSFSDHPWSAILQKTHPYVIYSFKCVVPDACRASFREASPIRTAETHLHLDGYLRESSSIGFDCWNRTTHKQKESVTIWRHVLKKTVSYVCLWRIWQHNTNTQNRENAKGANAASHFSSLSLSKWSNKQDQPIKTKP